MALWPLTTSLQRTRLGRRRLGSAQQYMAKFKPTNRYPLWLEITLLAGLAIIFCVTYWQYQDAKRSFEYPQPETQQAAPQK